MKTDDVSIWGRQRTGCLAAAVAALAWPVGACCQTPGAVRCSVRQCWLLSHCRMPQCGIAMHGAEAAACRLLPPPHASPAVFEPDTLCGWLKFHAPIQDYEYEPEEEHSEEEEHYGDAQSRGEGRPLAGAWSGWLHLGVGLVQHATSVMRCCGQRQDGSCSEVAATGGTRHDSAVAAAPRGPTAASSAAECRALVGSTCLWWAATRTAAGADAAAPCMLMLGACCPLMSAHSGHPCLPLPTAPLPAGDSQSSSPTPAATSRLPFDIGSIFRRAAAAADASTGAPAAPAEEDEDALAARVAAQAVANAIAANSGAGQQQQPKGLPGLPGRPAPRGGLPGLPPRPGLAGTGLPARPSGQAQQAGEEGAAAAPAAAAAAPAVAAAPAGLGGLGAARQQQPMLFRRAQPEGEAGGAPAAPAAPPMPTSVVSEGDDDKVRWVGGTGRCGEQQEQLLGLEG